MCAFIKVIRKQDRDRNGPHRGASFPVFSALLLTDGVDEIKGLSPFERPDAEMQRLLLLERRGLLVRLAFLTVTVAAFL